MRFTNKQSNGTTMATTNGLVGVEMLVATIQEYLRLQFLRAWSIAGNPLVNTARIGGHLPVKRVPATSDFGSGRCLDGLVRI